MSLLLAADQAKWAAHVEAETLYEWNEKFCTIITNADGKVTGIAAN